MAEVFDFGLQQHKIKMDGKFFENNLFAVAGDTGRRLEVQLLDSNNMIQNTTGISLRLNASVAGQATYAEATLVDATKGLYELDLPNGMLIAPGNWQFQWQIIGTSGEKLHSFAFTGSVGSNLSEGGSEATNFYLNVDDLKQMQEDLVNGTFNSEVLETNITEKLTDLETQYAPKLNEVTAQLAHKAELGELLQVQSQVDSFVTETSTGMTDTGSLELVAARTDIDAYTFDNASRRIDQLEKNIKELDVVAVIGDNHINATSFIGKPITTLNNAILKLPKGVTLKNNTPYKFVISDSNNVYPVDGSVVAFHRADGTLIGSVPFNSSVGNPKLSETAYLKFTTYSAVGTLNIKTMGLFLNGVAYKPFGLYYKSTLLETLENAKNLLLGEEVNTFKKENTIEGYFNTGTGLYTPTALSFKSVYAICKPNTTYTVSKKLGTFFAIGESTTIPSSTTVVTNIKSNSSVSSLTITTSSTAKYIIANVYNVQTETSTLQEIIDSIVISADNGNSYPEDSFFIGDKIIVDEKNMSETVKSLLYSTSLDKSWDDTIWVSYGDSIVQAGLWQPYITTKLNFASHEKNGIGGTTASNANSVGYLCQQSRIDSIQTTNPSLIFVSIGTNDHGLNVLIGDFGYTTNFDESTYKGGLCSTIVKLQIKFPNARIVLASPLSGRGNETGVNMTTQVKNSLGLTTEDYAKASKEVAHFMSIPFIDMFGKTGINQFNRAKYISDSVHPNELGQKRMAEVALGELKLINPIS